MAAMTFQEYVTEAAERAGSDAALGKICGFADGSRIGRIRRDATAPRFSELVCVRLARYTNDDPLWVLALAGYEELAGLLRGAVPHEVEQTRQELLHLQSIINLALQATGGQDNGKTHEGDQTTSRRMGSPVDGKRRDAAHKAVPHRNAAKRAD